MPPPPAGSRLTHGYAIALASAAVLSTTAIFEGWLEGRTPAGMGPQTEAVPPT